MTTTAATATAATTTTTTTTLIGDTFLSFLSPLDIIPFFSDPEPLVRVASSFVLFLCV